MTTPTPGPEAPNVVLYHMMMHYKESMEKAQLHAAEQQEKTHIAYRHKEEAVVRLVATLHRHELLDQETRRLRTIMVHKNGMIADFYDGMGSLFDTIDMVNTTNIDESPAVKYVYYEMDRIRGRLAESIERCNELVDATMPDDESEADEVIDLTGEETEEDEVEPTPWNNVPLGAGRMTDEMIWDRNLQRWVPYHR